MSDTQYLAAKTVDEAVDAHAKANGSARFLAGGTDLLVQIKSGIRKPNLVIDIKKIVELNSIQEISENEFVIGASVSGANLNRNPKFAKLWPGVLEAFRLIGSEQIQGRASLGGNLCNGSPACCFLFHKIFRGQYPLSFSFVVTQGHSTCLPLRSRLSRLLWFMPPGPDWGCLPLLF